MVPEGENTLTAHLFCELKKPQQTQNQPTKHKNPNIPPAQTKNPNTHNPTPPPNEMGGGMLQHSYYLSC